MHLFYKLCIIFGFFLSLHSFHSFLILLKLFLLLLLKNIAKELTSESLFILFSFLLNVRIVILSLLSKLKREFSFALFVNFLMHLNFISIDRSIKFTFLLQLYFSFFKFTNTHLLLEFFLESFINIFRFGHFRLMVPFKFTNLAFFFCSLVFKL